jgi:hypothetical protein
MGTESPRLGDPIPAGTTVYRAFSKESFRKRQGDSGKVRSGAYYRTPDHIDGLSLGTTPEAAVSGLSSNHGYCSISVDDIRKLRYGLEVRPYLDDPSHLVLCGVPIMDPDIRDEDRGHANEVASSLAKKSNLITCDPFPAKPKEPTPPPEI